MKKYECGYCLKSYETIEERMRCEKECMDNAEKRARLEKISILKKDLEKLKKKEIEKKDELREIRDEICNLESELSRVDASTSTESVNINQFSRLIDEFLKFI